MPNNKKIIGSTLIIGVGVFVAVVIVVLAIPRFEKTDRLKTGVADTGVIAIVLGEKITANEKDKLSGLILGPLLERYAKENKIEP